VHLETLHLGQMELRILLSFWVTREKFCIVVFLCAWFPIEHLIGEDSVFLTLHLVGQQHAEISVLDWLIGVMLVTEAECDVKGLALSGDVLTSQSEFVRSEIVGYWADFL